MNAEATRTKTNTSDGFGSQRGENAPAVLEKRRLTHDEIRQRTNPRKEKRA